MREEASTGTLPHLLWVFPGFGVGGAQVRFAALANHLGNLCRHTVVSLNGDIACVEKLKSGLDISLPGSGHRRGRMLDSVQHARRFLRRARPDCVITSNWGAIEWAIGARLAGLRHVHSEDGFGPEERDTQIPRRALTRRLVLRGSAVILPSQTLGTIARTSWRLPERVLHIIPNGIDLARFSGAPALPAPAGEGVVIGTIAALRSEKNIGRLLRAFAALRATRPAQLLIVGDGPERAGLEALAAALGIAADTHFAGHSTVSERWLARFDVFALSSDTEQMPLSLLEAMASGLPAVCTDVGDVRTMLAAENLPYVTAASDHAFASGLDAVVSAADETGIGAANRAKARAAYGQEQMFAAWRLVVGA